MFFPFTSFSGFVFSKCLQPSFVVSHLLGLAGRDSCGHFPDGGLRCITWNTRGLVGSVFSKQKNREFKLKYLEKLFDNNDILFQEVHGRDENLHAVFFLMTKMIEKNNATPVTTASGPAHSTGTSGKWRQAATASDVEGVSPSQPKTGRRSNKDRANALALAQASREHHL